MNGASVSSNDYIKLQNATVTKSNTWSSVNTASTQNGAENIKSNSNGVTDNPSSVLQPNDPYTINIFLVHYNYTNFLGYYQLLRVSLQFSNLKLIEFYETTLNCLFGTFTCKVGNTDLILGRGQGKTQREARNNAAVESLKLLLQKCFTLKIKKKTSSQGEVSLRGVSGCFDGDFEKISDNNIGAKLLKQMGWSGGALGRTGEGITEPIKTPSVIGRQGLGIQDETAVTPQFVSNVRQIIKSYRCSDDPSDLVFSSDLSADQRKQIQIIVSQMGKNKLKALICGKGRNRYLTVKRKSDGLDLIRMVFSQGGVTDKYELCKPGTITLEQLSEF